MMAKYVLVACEVVKRDFDMLVPAGKNKVDIIYMDLGLHAAGQEKMTRQLQEALDAIDQTAYDAILLGYGLCSNGITTLHASIPIVVARAHDCVTLFMGSRQAYREYFDTHKGTWYVTTGNLDTVLTDELTGAGEGSLREKLRAEYREKYDEEEAEYLLEMLGDPLKEYQRITFVDNGLGDVTDKRNYAKGLAQSKNWEYDEFVGNTGMLRGLIAGSWDPAVFLVVQPGEKIAQSYNDDEIVTAVP
jgi:hypothetical protein